MHSNNSSHPDNIIKVLNDTDSSRLAWLDTMKCFGLFIIVSGHYTPPGFEYLYVFSVQLFFIISGYLSKAISFVELRNKLVSQLIVPMILLSLIVISLNTIRQCINGSFSTYHLLQEVMGIIVGDSCTLGGLWFVYTLIITKLLGQIPNMLSKGILAIICLVSAWLYNNYSLPVAPNCWLNILLAFPMFFIGEVFRFYRHPINDEKRPCILLLLMLVGGLGVYICGSVNGTVWMYRCIYGTNIFLFLIGSICGTVMLYGFSKLIFNKYNRFIRIISEGSIIILALHIQFVTLGLHYPIGYGYYIEAAFVLLGFIPVITFCQQKIPILLGYRGRNRTLKII